MEYFEPQYSILDDDARRSGLCQFGPMASFTWNTDPKRLLFVLSRYKFAAKILEGSENVVEVGCGDGFAARIVKQHVKNLLITDIDPRMVAYAEKVQCAEFPVASRQHNFLRGPILDISEKFDGAYLLDVLEHISKEDEIIFLSNLKMCLAPGAKVVIGMPSLESQVYASAGSKAGHVNCKTKEDLLNTTQAVFQTVCCFSMNDEVMHTGFSRMSNYIFAVAVV
jgi:2-polyprenyl-3-methyl-5-hydroxy-6-metoxy-1,4-benzoquinol methylase